MRLIACAAVGDCRDVIRQLNRRKQVVGLADGRLHRVTGVPDAAVGFAVRNAREHAGGFVDFHAGFPAEAEARAVIVHFLNAQKPAGFIEKDVARFIQRLAHVDIAVIAGAFERRVGELGVNARTFKSRRFGDNALFKPRHGNGRFHRRTRGVSTHQRTIPQWRTAVRRQSAVIIIIGREVITRIGRAGEHTAGLHVNHNRRTDRRNRLFVAIIFNKSGKRVLHLFLQVGINR